MKINSNLFLFIIFIFILFFMFFINYYLKFYTKKELFKNKKDDLDNNHSDENDDDSDEDEDDDSDEDDDDYEIKPNKNLEKNKKPDNNQDYKENKIENKYNDINVILFTNARDEDNILDWIAHHKNLGFDKIYIIDHKSEKPIKDLYNYENFSNYIIVERNDRELSKKNNKDVFIMKSVKYARENKYDWMIYIDADEYIILNKYNNVKELLYNYKDYDLVGLNWLLFGNNDHETKPKGTLFQNYTKCQKNLNEHIKSFVRPDKVVKEDTPHTFSILDNNKRVDIDKKVLKKKLPYFNYINKSFNEVDAYIAHYIYQSYETFKHRKGRKNDILGYSKIMPYMKFKKLYNDVENIYPYEKYNDINKKTVLFLQNY